MGNLQGGWSLTVVVQKPPELTVRENGDGRVVLTLHNSGNRTFLIDYSTNFQDWQTLGQFPASSNAVSILDWHDKDRRFYRVRRNSP